MRVLMSLNNVGLFNAQFSLVSVDAERHSGLDLVDCSGFIDPARDGGITGMVRLADGGLALCVQGSPPRVVFLNAEMKLRRAVGDPRFVDLHALCLRDGFVFVTSTGVNKILKISLDTYEVSAFWEYPVEEPFLHINSLAFIDERPVVASHKLPPEADGGGMSAGCWRLDDYEVLIPGLRHPHTLMAEGSTLSCLSSADGRVVSWRNGEVVEKTVEGYLRGMARIGERVVIGSSSRRFVSRKRHGVHRYADFSKVVGNTIYMSNLVLANKALKPKRRINTTVAGFEIFDVVEDTGVPEELRRRPAGPIRMQTSQRLVISLREEAHRLKQELEAMEQRQQEGEEGG